VFQEDKAHLLSQWDDAAAHANFLDLLHMPTQQPYFAWLKNKVRGIFYRVDLNEP